MYCNISGGSEVFCKSYIYMVDDFDVYCYVLVIIYSIFMVRIVNGFIYGVEF